MFTSKKFKKFKILKSIIKKIYHSLKLAEIF